MVRCHLCHVPQEHDAVLRQLGNVGYLCMSHDAHWTNDYHRKLPAGYTVLSLQCTSYLCILLLRRASCTFRCPVWYHALSLRMHELCACLTYGHYPQSLGYFCAKFCFCHDPHPLQRKITYSIIQSISQSLS